jgi:hypothetical protein
LKANEKGFIDIPEDIAGFRGDVIVAHNGFAIQ